MANSTRLMMISTTMITVVNASRPPRFTSEAAQPSPTAASASETAASDPRVRYGRSPTRTTATAT